MAYDNIDFSKAKEKVDTNKNTWLKNRDWPKLYNESNAPRIPNNNISSQNTENNNDEGITLEINSYSNNYGRSGFKRKNEINMETEDKRKNKMRKSVADEIETINESNNKTELNVETIMEFFEDNEEARVLIKQKILELEEICEIIKKPKDAKN